MSDPGVTPAGSLRKRSAHLGAHSVPAPSFLPTFGGDHALRTDSLPEIRVIPFSVEFRVGQHHPDACLLGSGLDHCCKFAQSFRGPRRAIATTGIADQIRHDHPLQPKLPLPRFCPAMMHPSHEEGTDPSLCQARHWPATAVG